jgi:predicted glycosyltransferase involved in capsule biosynthesis
MRRAVWADISITFVEHDSTLHHEDLCVSSGVSYIGIKCKEGEPFNKCLAHNIGAIMSCDSEWLLFHDVDCLVQEFFFRDLLVNSKLYWSEAFQAFARNRVLYCSEDLTKKLVGGVVSVDKLTIDSDGITVGAEGAPGGSIFITRELFFFVGGYDPELFWGYSPEDKFFWTKVSICETITSCNNIEIFHLHHEFLGRTNPSLRDMKRTMKEFLGLSKQDRFAIIEYKRELIERWL